MGFSVSGSAAIIFAGMFIAFGAWYTATANSFERVSEAQSARADDALATKNTAITVDSASYDATADTLTVRATNEGATTLGLNETDLLLDNAYVAGWQENATVAGNADTGIWQPGEQLTITVNRTAAPDRVRLVTETGVADTEVVA